MRNAFSALLIGTFASCDAGAHCGGCAPPRGSVAAGQDAGVNLTFAPIETPSPPPPPPRATAMPSVVTAPPAYPSAVSITTPDAAPSAMTSTPAPPVPTVQPTAERAPSSLEDAEVPAGADASMFDSGESETGAADDAAPD